MNDIGRTRSTSRTILLTLFNMNITTTSPDATRRTLMQPSEPVEVKRREFVSAMAAVPTAVTVVAFNDGEQIWGQTVSAFASVTADPPTLLVCINTRSPLHHHLEPGSKFSVNVLAPSQVEIANCFAGKSSEKLA